MHKRILEDANSEQVREFATDFICELMEENPSIYEKAERRLYEKVYGKHFSEWLLDEAVKCMDNEDGSKGSHWSVDQTDSVANSLGIKFNDFNRYDWNYTMNMIYSDFYGAVPNSTETYARMAKKFIDDKDFGEGKAYEYYQMVK